MNQDKQELMREYQRDAFEKVRNGEISANTARALGGFKKVKSLTNRKNLRPAAFRQNVEAAKACVAMGKEIEANGQLFVALPASAFLHIAKTLDML